MSEETYKVKAKRFFDNRASHIKGLPITNSNLCYVSGRDKRIWQNLEMLDDLKNSILTSAQINSQSKILEVGCAAGFIAKLLSSHVGSYEGVDVSKNAVKVAKKLALKNAKFSVADGANLPYPNDYFDSSLCYDVLTNFPAFYEVVPIIKEMVRVTKPKGKVLMGSIPDQDKSEEYVSFVQNFQKVLGEQELNKKDDIEKRSVVKDFVKNLFNRIKNEKCAEIICYYFYKKDFIDLGHALDLDTKITNIHEKNPYSQFRFNVIFTKS